MIEQEQANITKKDNPFFQSQLKQTKSFVFGDESPNLYTQIVFFVGLTISLIFELWNVISFMILKFPLYLKSNRQVDVEAIVALRGSELGFEEGIFYRNLEYFNLIGIVVWVVVIAGLIFLWRKKKWSTYAIVGSIIVYLISMIFLLGMTYFIEDTTLFDKIILLLILVLVFIFHFISNEKKSAPTEDVPS